MKGDVVRRLFLTFVFAGCFGAVSQLMVMGWRAVLGPDSPWIMACMLLCLGAVGAVLYVFGIYQKLEEVGTMGAVMPFSGLVSAVAAAFEQGYAEGGGARGAWSGFAFFLYVLGVGSCLAAVVGLVAFFAG